MQRAFALLTALVAGLSAAASPATSSIDVEQLKSDAAGAIAYAALAREAPLPAPKPDPAPPKKAASAGRQPETTRQPEANEQAPTEVTEAKPAATPASTETPLPLFAPAQAAPPAGDCRSLAADLRTVANADAVLRDAPWHLLRRLLRRQLWPAGIPVELPAPAVWQMTSRLCTSCEVPHVTTDYYVIEATHPLRGEVECSLAHEDRIRRETRDRYDDRAPRNMGHAASQPQLWLLEDNNHV
jgi:hypothetical protein